MLYRDSVFFVFIPLKKMYLLHSHSIIFKRVSCKIYFSIYKCLNIPHKPYPTRGGRLFRGCRMIKNNRNKEIFDVFFREKPAMMLVELKNADATVYASVLAKQIDCTYSHVVKILQEMQKADLINFKKEGRLKLLELTKKGREIASNIESIKTML